MKLIRLLAICYLIISTNYLLQAQQVLLFEDFESGSLPTDWTEIKVKGQVGGGDLIVNWDYDNGGHSGFPSQAYSGSFNALFWFFSQNREATKLVTPPVDLTGKVKPVLQFYHAQHSWSPYPNDELRIYMKRGADSAWISLNEYLSETPDWTKRQILIADSLFSDSCYFAFEATTRGGHGVCIDSVIIFETTITPRTLSNLTITHPTTNFIPSGSKNAVVLQLAMTVQGNTGTLLVDSLVVKSLCTDNSKYVENNGVKLFYTTQPYFSRSNQVGTSQSIVTGKAVFDNLALSLPTGESYLWVTFDVRTGHDTIHNTIIDAMIEPNNFRVGTSTYPSVAQSPAGSRKIYESIFFDNFETLTGWTFPVVDTFINEFQIDTTCIHCATPIGGTTAGNPDPQYAYSGTKVLGTDLTRLGSRQGDYERYLSNRAYQAVSPIINCSYYKDLRLSYQRYLNCEFFDKASIDISINNGLSFPYNLYTNNTTVTDYEWVLDTININSYALNKPQVKIRFCIGETNNLNDYSGWNIDDFVITGDYITRDAGISKIVAPSDGCGHTSSDSIKVMITNYGANAITGSIPVMISFNSGITTEIRDTFNGTVPSGDTVLFTFKRTINLSSPYFYPIGSIYATTYLSGDEDPGNDSLQYKLFVVPTYTVPYSNNFETNNGFWRTTYTNHYTEVPWGYGTPNQIVMNKAASGTKVWATSLNRVYYIEDTAYLQGPCFDFTGIKHPVFELNYFSQLQDTADGVALQYSINNGATWQICDTHTFNFNWPWYNFPYVRALKTGGWSGTLSTDYNFAKQVLPAPVGRKNLVQFRMAFISDTVEFNEGFAFDDIRLYSAPNDIGVSRLVYPVDSCELSSAEKVTVAIKNYNFDTLFAGYKFLVTVNVNNTIRTDTVTAHRNVPVNDTLHYTMKNTFNFYQSGKYFVKSFTSSFEYDNIYSATPYNNDSILDSVLVRKPSVELGADKYTVHPDTVVLNAFAAYCRYKWQDASTGSIFNVSDGGQYSVTVTDSITTCVARDTMDVIRLIADVGVSAMVSPTSACELGSNVPVTVKIKNFGTDTIRGYTIYCYYQVDGGTIRKDTLVKAGPVYPDSTFTYTFKNTVNMTAEKVYSFSSFTQYIDDDTTHNDTSSDLREIWGYPAFDLTPDDTIHIGFRFLLNARKGDTTFKTFTWTGGTTDSTLPVNTQGTGYYACTVTDVHGCPSADTSMVRLVYQDVLVAEVLKPLDHCGPIKSDSVRVKIRNTGTDTLLAASYIPMVYRINAWPAITDSVLLSQPFRPGDSLYATFRDTLSIAIIDTNSITAYTALRRDSVVTNDTTHYSFIVRALPVINLGKDTTTNNVTQYILDAGTGRAGYRWQDNSTGRYFTVNSDNGTHTYSRYTVTVTDSLGCSNSDTVYVALPYRDIRLSSTTLPSTACYLPNQPVTVRIKNRGTQPLIANTIIFSFKVNTDTARVRNYTLPSILYHNDSLSYTFDSTYDMTGAGNYNYTLIAKMTTDIVASNDTLLKQVTLYGLPPITWTDPGIVNDSLVTPADPYILQMNESYSGYIWSTGATTASISLRRSGWYKVTVSDIHSCIGQDSVYIKSTGIQETIPETIFTYYPNPAHDLLYITLSSVNERSILVKITSANGVVTMNNKIEVPSDKLITIDISGLAPGLYHLSLTGKYQRLSGKIIVQ